MPTNRKRKSRINNDGLPDKYCREELLSGPCLLGGLGYFIYADNSCDLDRMEVDWKRLSSEIMATWLLEHPGTRPYAWWQFDAPEPLLESESERAYLEQHKLLQPCELLQSGALR